MATKATIKGNVLHLEIDMQPPTASGKTLVIASTRGNQSTDLVVQGKNVVVGVNAYISAK